MRVIIPHADFEDLHIKDADATSWLDLSGFSDPAIRKSVNKFYLADKACGAYAKLDYLIIVLGNEYDKVKRNMKNPAGTVISPFTVSLNKGFVLTSAGSVPGPQVVLPLTNVDTANLFNNGGHCLYVINETLAPTTTVNPGIGMIVTNTENDAQAKSMTFSGSMALPNKKVLQLNGKTCTLTPPYLTRGACGFIIAPGSGVVTWYGNKSNLGSAALTGTGTVGVSNVRLGASSNYGVNNTVSVFSFGTTPMTEAEYVGHVDAINTLLNEVWALGL